HALLQSRFERVPFVRRNDSRHEIERNQSLGAFSFAVNREGDADAMKRALRFVAFLRDSIGRSSIEPVGEGPVMGAHGAIGRAHFVVGVGGHSKFCCRVSRVKQSTSHHRISFAGSGLGGAGMARSAVANHAGTYSHYFGATPSWTGLYTASDCVCGTP